MEEINLVFAGVVWFKEVINAFTLFMSYVFIGVGGEQWDLDLALNCINAIQRVLDYLWEAMQEEPDWLYDYFMYLARAFQ